MVRTVKKQSIKEEEFTQSKLTTYILTVASKAIGCHWHHSVLEEEI